MGTTRTKSQRTQNNDSSGAGRMHVTVVQRARKAPAGAISKALPESGFQYGIGPYAILEPRASPDLLADQPNKTQALKPCIKAHATAVHGLGHTWEPRRTPDGEAEEREAKEEQDDLEEFLEYSSRECSWTETCTRFGEDRKTVGYGILEVLRDESTGDIAGLVHHPARLFRMTEIDLDPVTETFKKWDRKKGDWTEGKAERRFRRFVQMVDGGKRRYFKELGDPRNLDMDTGEFEKTEGSLPEARWANELIFSCNYDSTTPYGLPDWVGLWDDTKSDEHASGSTRDYFEDGAIPKLWIGFLNAVPYDEDRKALEAALEGTKGSYAMNRVIVTSASTPPDESNPVGGGPAKTASCTVTKLNDLQQGDALFAAFRKDHHRRVRVSMRMPGLFVGEEEAANFATANVLMQTYVSMNVAPDQSAFDYIMNTKILPARGAKWWRYKSKGPALEDNQTWLQAVDLGSRLGAIPDFPTLRNILSEVLGFKLRSGDDKGVLATWEKMPPGFVSYLVQSFRALPVWGDISEALGGFGGGDDAAPVERSRDGGRHSAFERFSERLADAVASGLLKGRQKLVQAMGASREVV